MNKDIYEINYEFLEALLQKKTNFDKNKIVNTMCHFIKNSKLIKKLESEASERKSDMDNLIYNCAKNLGYVKLEREKILFKIGDIGDKFYFILKGKISVLKLKELKNIYMTNVEYLKYCIFLINNKEDYILNEVFKKNKKYFDIISTDDIIKIYRIVCIKILREKIIEHIIVNNAQLLEFFNEYNLTMSSFHLIEAELTQLEEQKDKDEYTSAKDWENYILKKIRPSIKESIFFEEYEEIFKDRKRKYNITCYIYETFLYFGPGLFFGDFALDSDISKRNGTIRAEEKTYLAWMKGIDYANIIAPKRKIEKYNEIMFLYKNFFFKKLNVYAFEKKFFHLFPPREFIKGDIIHYQNSIPSSLYFIKNGQIQIELKVSIMELQFLIEQLFERMIKNKYYKKVFREKGANYLIDIDTYKKIKNLIKEPFLEKLRDKNARFLTELNKRTSNKLTIITERELIGLEEMFLGIGYLTTGKVISDKVNCYELSEKQLNLFLEEEKSIILLYTKYSINKILALIDKLQNLRKNRIYQARTKYENAHIPPPSTENEKNSENKISNDIIIKKEDNEQINELNENKDENFNEEINEIKDEEVMINSYNNQNKKEFGNNYPLTKQAKLNIKKILLEKYPEKAKKKEKYLNSIMKSKGRKNITNQKKIFKKKNYSFFNDIKEDKKMTSQESSINNIIKYSIPEVKYKKDNSYFVGNTCINIDKIKQDIKNFNFNLDEHSNIINNKNIIYNSLNLKNDHFSKIFELSQLRYPLTNRYELNSDEMNINSDSIYKNTKNNNNNDNNNNASLINDKSELKESEKNYFLKRAKSIKQIFYKKLNKRNMGNNTTIAKSLFLSGNNQQNIIDINQEENNPKKIIRRKDLLPKIIKEFDNKMRDKVVNSYINKGKKDKTRIKKIENKNDNNLNDYSDILPIILGNK